MDLTSILGALPQIISLLNSLKGTFASATPPPASAPAAKASQVIKDLQALVNVLAKPVPLLDEDGWLGPKTEAELAKVVTAVKSHQAAIIAALQG